MSVWWYLFSHELTKTNDSNPHQNTEGDKTNKDDP